MYLHFMLPRESEIKFMITTKKVEETGEMKESGGCFPTPLGGWTRAHFSKSPQYYAVLTDRRFRADGVMFPGDGATEY